MNRALMQLLFRFDVFRRSLGEDREQTPGSGRRRNFALADNFFCAQFPAI